MSGRIEEEILTLERQYFQLPDPAALAKRLAALEQSLMAIWMYTPAAAGGCTVNDFSSVCPNLPCTITLHDSYYGDCTLTYDASALTWTGCAIVTLPANPSCGAVPSFAIHYALSGSNSSTSWPLVVSYKVANFTTHCPVASTCSDATNQNLNLTLTMHCTGTSSVSFSVNGTIPGTQCYPAFRNVTLSFTL